MVPSLQQRIQENPSEIDELIAHTVERITGERAEDLIKAVKEVVEKELPGGYHWPGNVRELAQCVRRVIIKRDYRGDRASVSDDLRSKLLGDIDSCVLDAQALLAGYCTLLYKRYGTYEQVSRKTNLDRRTVKKYIEHFLQENKKNN